MAFIVEDGSGVLNAISYATVDFYKAYLKDRGVTNSLGGSAIQKLLVKATDYIETVNRHKFSGTIQFGSLLSKSALTLSAQTSDGETITVGSVVYTFKTTAVLASEVTIGTNVYETTINLISAVANLENDDLSSTLLLGTTLYFYVSADGVATTHTLTTPNGFGFVSSSGFSPFAQPLSFPRVNLVDAEGLTVTGVPDGIMKGTVEYAFRSGSAVLLPDPVNDATGRELTQDVVKVGPIELNKRFSEVISEQIIKPYPAADLLINPYLKFTGSVIRA